VVGDSIDLALAATAGSDGVVVTTNAADGSSLATVSDSALVADGNSTLHTADMYFSLDAGRDWFDLPGHAGFSFGEGRSDATEDTNDGAVIALANGQSIEPSRVHVMAAAENNFAFGQTPVPQLIEHDTTPGDGGSIAGSHSHWNSNLAMSSIVTSTNEDNMSSKGGQLGNGESVSNNAGPINAAGPHGRASDAGPNVVHDASGGLVANAIENSRGPWTDGGHQTNLGEANGHGVAAMGSAGAPHFEASSTADMVFGSQAAGTHGLEQSFHFKDQISGLGASTVVDPAEAGFGPASVSHRENAAGASGPHALAGEIPAIELSSLGQHAADNFSIVPNQAEGGTVVTHVPHDLIV
jgi:hypothetical protein